MHSSECCHYFYIICNITDYSRSGINQMWILKNSKELLEHLKSPTFNRVTSIKSFDFSTLYTTIPHQKLKERLTSIIRNAFIFKNGNRRYKYLVLGHEETYFVKEHSDSKSKYSEDDIIKMLEFLVDNIFVVFAGKVFQQTVGIPMGTNCAPLLADIFLYSYEADFIQSLLSTGKKHLASWFNLTYGQLRLIRSVWRASKFSVFKIEWNCNFVGLLHHPFWLQLVKALLGITFQLFKLLSLAKDHWRGFSTRNAHMVHIVN